MPYHKDGLYYPELEYFNFQALQGEIKWPTSIKNLAWLEHFPVPKNNSGRGVHGPPGAFPNGQEERGFLAQWDFWSEQLLAMGIQWVKIMDTGDGSSLELGEKLVDIGIMPVVRFYEQERYPNLAKADREIITAKKYVDLGAYYFEINNEPDLSLEWKDGKRPDNWLDIVVDNFIAHADMIRGIDGYLLFPAFGPGGRGNPFQMIVERGRKDLLDGNMCLAIHNYCLARPLDYPNDKVTMYGEPITKQQWLEEASDKKINGPMWAWEMSWEKVNEYRKEMANPNASIMEDSTCFRAYEYFDALIREACGHSIPIFTAEGGYNVGQRAGTTAGDDPRWPKPSPQRVAEQTLAMFQAVEEGPDYYFACMPWLIAVESMGYWQSDFRQQGPWFSWDFQFDFYDCENGQLPVVQLLKDNPPKEKTGGETMTTNRRPGIWVANGHPGNTVEQMYAWNPGAVTCIYDYLQPNDVFQYKEKHPEVDVIVRFMHPKDWGNTGNPVEYAEKYGREVVSKWPDLKAINPYVYVANEINLHYENGEPDVGRQSRFETPEFYQKYADWLRIVADTIKNAIPEMRLVTPPFAFGHHEDGAPIDGIPQEGWAGYDYLVGYNGGKNIISDYFDNILTFHAYWRGRNYHPDTLYLWDDDAQWHAFRWVKLLELFKVRYGIDAKVIIDEAGNFSVGDADFFAQISYFAQECLKNKDVLALTYFLWSDPTDSAGNLPNAWVQGAANLSGLVEKLKEMPDIVIDDEVEEPEPQPEPQPEPEPEPAQAIRMTVETGEGLPIIVGDWLEPNKVVKLLSPHGTNLGLTMTGQKPEHGVVGGFEAGYAHDPGDHTLIIDGHEFKVPGGKFTRVSFERLTDEIKVKLVSDEMNDGMAQRILILLNELDLTKEVFHIEQ